METVRELWAELGLKVNEQKLKVWAASPEVAQALSQNWRKGGLVSPLKMLVQRLSMKVEPEGLDFDPT